MSNGRSGGGSDGGSGDRSQDGWGDGGVDAGVALVRAHTVLSVAVGAAAWGLDAAGEEDPEPGRRGVFVAPTELFWRFDKPPTTVAGPELGRVSFEVEEFCARGLAAEPSAFDVLASPLVEWCGPIGSELRELTSAFLSQRVADAYRRATATGFARASAAMVRRGTPRWGQVAEIIRQLLGGERLLRTGELVADVSPFRDSLFAVRDGQMAWSDVQSWVTSLRDRSAEAVLHSPLPVTPDVDRVQDWLASVRRRALDAG